MFHFYRQLNASRIQVGEGPRVWLSRSPSGRLRLIVVSYSQNVALNAERVECRHLKLASLHIDLPSRFQK
jgi:hypothetical protein